MEKCSINFDKIEMFPSGHNPILSHFDHRFWWLLPVFLLYGVISKPDRHFFFK